MLISKLPHRNIFSVASLTAEIRHCLEEGFSDLWVEGEISDLRRPRSGHLYFTLKDDRATISIVIFRSHLRFLKFLPEEGKQVLLRGHLSLYEARGQYQLICDYLEPRGAGALQAAFEALKDKLRFRGWFDEEKKQALPLLPSRIGIITSATGAALQDMLKILEESSFACHILIHPVLVQGIGSASQIAKAIAHFNRMKAQTGSQPDLLIVARGGGSLEDLWAFNEEEVAHAIWASKIPVISAVGHESDTTISDHVADIRAATPSVAAKIVTQLGEAAETSAEALRDRLHEAILEIIAQNKRRLEVLSPRLISPSKQNAFYRDQVKGLSHRRDQAILNLIEKKRREVFQQDQGLSHLSPLSRIAGSKQHLLEVEEALNRAMDRLLSSKKQQLHAEMEQLHLLSPLNILGRGYSITRKKPGLSVVRDIDEVDLGEALQITLHQGELICRVEKKKHSRHTS